MDHSVHELIIQDLERLSSLYTISDQRSAAPPPASQSGATAVALRVDGLDGLEGELEPSELDSLRTTILDMLVTLGQSRGAVEPEVTEDSADRLLLFSGRCGSETHAAVALSTASRMSQVLRYVSEHVDGGELSVAAGLDSADDTMNQAGLDGLLQSAAAVLESCGTGELLVTDACKASCGDFFSWRSVEGRKIALGVLYSPLESGVASTSGIDRLLELHWPNMVDRETELQRLVSSASDALTDDGQGLSTLVWVSGDMGIGKTRLVDELESRLAEMETPPAFVRGRAVHYGNTPYGTWSSVLSDVLRREGLPPLQASVSRLLSDLDDRVEVPFLLDGLPYLEAMIGGAHPSMLNGSSRKTGTGLAVRCLLEALAGLEGGLVLFIDNLHWIDRTSMDILQAIMERPLKSGRAMMVVTSRESPETEAPSALEVVPVELGPLFDEQILDLARETLGAKKLPKELGDYLVSSCRGNPFHLQELIYSLVESAVIEPDSSGECRILDSSFFRGPAPGVQGVLIDRIGRQGEELRKLLQLASVIDERFSARLLARLARDMEYPVAVWSALEALDGAGLVRRTGDETYEFSHSMVRDAAYDTILHSGRQRLHGRVASIMEDIYSGDLSDQAATIAHHWAMAGEMGKAVPLAIRAMNGFVERGELEQAEEWLSRVERWLRGMPQNARFLVDWEVLRCRQSIHRIRAELPRQAEELDRMSVMAEESMNPAWLAEVEMEWGGHHYVSGNLASARRRYRSALDTARRADLGEIRARCLRGLAEVERMGGDAELAAELLRESADQWKSLGNETERARAMTSLATVSEKLLSSEAAMDLYLQALTLSRDAGNKQMEAGVLHSMSVFCRASGHPRQAMIKASHALALARAIGNSSRECILLKHIGQLHLDRNEYGRAQQMMEKALFIARERGLVNMETNILGSLGPLLRARGRVDEAVEVTERALAMARDRGAAMLEAPLLCNIGGLEIERGNLDGSRARFEEALELARRSQSFTAQAGILTNLAYLSAVKMEKSRALEEYGAALSICRKMSLKSLEGKLRLNRAALLVQDGDYDGFRSDIRVVRYLAGEEDNRLLEARADRQEAEGLLLIGRYDKAIETCTRAMETFEQLGNDLQRCRSLCALGRIHHALGEYDEAQRCYDSVFHRPCDGLPGDLRCAVNQGQAEICRSRGELKEAEEHLRKASYLRETTGAPLSRLEQMLRYGRVLAASGDGERAAALLETVEDLSPETYLRTRLHYLGLQGWIMVAQERFDEAREFVAEMVSQARGFSGMLSRPEADLERLEESLSAVDRETE